MPIKLVKLKLAIAKIAITLAGLALFVYTLTPPSLTVIQIVYAILFAIAIFVADHLVINVAEEGQIHAASTIIIAAVFLTSTELNMQTVAIAVLLGSIGTGVASKKKPINIAIFTSGRLFAIYATAYFFFLWTDDINKNVFTYTLAGALSGAIAYFTAEVATSSIPFAIKSAANFTSTTISRMRIFAFVYLTFSIVSLLMASMFKWMDFWSILIFSLPLGVSGQSFRLYLNIRRTYANSIKALAAVVETQNSTRIGHQARVTDYVTAMGREVGFYGIGLEMLNYAAALHDIGRLGYENEVEEHAEVGAEIIAMVPFLKEIAPIVGYHHTDFVKMKRQPIEARIINVVSSYDHLTNIENQLSWKEAIKIIEAGKGTTYDPRVVRRFKRMLRRQHRLFIFPSRMA